MFFVKALADPGKTNYGEEEEVYFDAISTDKKHNDDDDDDSILYEDVDGNVKHPNEKEYEIVNAENPITSNHRSDQDGINSKHQDEADLDHSSAGIYDTPRNVNAPACVTSSLNFTASDQDNQFELAKEQEHACLTSVIAKSDNSVHGKSSPNSLEFSKKEQVSESNTFVYDVAQNVSHVVPGDQSNIYELAQNVNKQDGGCDMVDIATTKEEADSADSKQIQQSAALFELAQGQNLYLSLKPEQQHPDTEVLLRSKDNVRKNQYDPAWTDSIFDKDPTAVLVPGVPKNKENAGPGLDRKDETKEQKQQLEDSIAEHRHMSESGNYDRLVLRESDARTKVLNRSAYNDTVLQAGSSRTLDSKDQGSSKSETLKSRHGKHKTHTRRRKGKVIFLFYSE